MSGPTPEELARSALLTAVYGSVAGAPVNAEPPTAMLVEVSKAIRAAVEQARAEAREAAELECARAFCTACHHAAAVFDGDDWGHGGDPCYASPIYELRRQRAEAAGEEK